MQEVVGTDDVGSNEIQRSLKSSFHNHWCSDSLDNHAGVRICNDRVGGTERCNPSLHSPLAYTILFFLNSAWIGPAEGKYAWLIPAAILVLLVPFFFASYGTEYLVMRFMVGAPEGGAPNVAYPRVRIAVRNANLITYGVMFVASSVWLVILLRHH